MIHRCRGISGSSLLHASNNERGSLTRYFIMLTCDRFLMLVACVNPCAASRSQQQIVL